MAAHLHPGGDVEGEGGQPVGEVAGEPGQLPGAGVAAVVPPEH